jgi:Tfp pilus assembly protein PilO
MEASKREKGLAIGVLGVCAILLLDQYALTPILEQQDALQIERDKIVAELSKAQKVMAERKQLAPKWHTMLTTGLKTDPAETEGDLLHAMRDWAKASGFQLTSVKPDRPESKEQLKEIHVQATGTGSMSDVAKFLHKIQSAPFPLKVSEFQLGSRNNSTTELALQVKLSTLYYPPDKKAAKSDKPEVASNGGAR